jgi:glycosyltransferase involved in cell wall biosynthesis
MEESMRKIAVLIPCYNEVKTIAGVVRDFRAQLPDAAIYVYDNNSTDKTGEEAERAGAIVRRETRQGKGNVMRSMFRQIEADIYVMVDGDGTYPADRVHDLITPIATGEADMVNGSRLHSLSKSSFKGLNLLGNKMFLFLLNNVFKVRLTDLLSGYRAFNWELVKNLPLLSRGFDIETELTLKAIERNYKIIEVPVNLSTRPEGSESKIHILRDGILIFNTIFALLRDYKPLTAFGSLGLFFIVLGFIPGIFVIREFLVTNYISHVPSAILAVGLVVIGAIIAFIGLVLHAIARRFQELDYQLQGLTRLLANPSQENELS